MEVFSELLKFLGAISLPLVTFIIFWFKNKKDKAVQENELLKDNIYISKVNILKEVFDLEIFSELDKVLTKTFNHTFCDRFSIMILMNGKVHFKYMTVLFDKEKDYTDGKYIMPYKKMLIDDKYHNLIININSGSSEWLHNDFERTGNIAYNLDDEEIKTVGYYKVKRMPLDEFNDLFVYCCWSSQSATKPTYKEMLNMDLITNGEVIPLINSIIKTPTIYNSDHLFSKINTK